jgi:hypothetical protein
MEMTNRKNNEKPVFFFKISSCEILPILNFERKLGIVLLERSQESHTALRSLGNIFALPHEKSYPGVRFSSSFSAPMMVAARSSP